MLELINKVYKIKGNKNQYTKYISFLQTNDKLSKIEINKKIAFTIAWKIKYLKINLTKEV